MVLRACMENYMRTSNNSTADIVNNKTDRKETGDVGKYSTSSASIAHSLALFKPARKCEFTFARLYIGYSIA